MSHVAPESSGDSPVVAWGECSGVTSGKKGKGGASSPKLPCKRRLWQRGNFGMGFQYRKLVMYTYICMYIGIDRRVTHLVETLWQSVTETLPVYRVSSLCHLRVLEGEETATSPV